MVIESKFLLSFTENLLCVGLNYVKYYLKNMYGFLHVKVFNLITNKNIFFHLKNIRSRNFESVCNLRVRFDFYIQGRREGMHLNRANLLKNQLFFRNQFWYSHLH